MEVATGDRQRLSGALQQAVRTALVQRSAVPVREIARSIIAETQSDPALYDDVLDALCALCIRSGLTLEFTRPDRIAA